MEKLNDNELININGGAMSFAVFAAIASAVTFLIGVIDGFTRPLKCR